MHKLIIQKVDNYDYILIDVKEEKIQLNIEFYSKYKPQVNDIIYIDNSIIRGDNLYAFAEIYDVEDINTKDIIKVISKDKNFYFQRIYG